MMENTLRLFQSRNASPLFTLSQALRRASQPVKKKTYLPSQETQVQSLGREHPLEKDMATHSGMLAWEVP